MLRALVWKEWRQQRSVVAAGVGLAFIFPVIAYVVGQTASNSVYAANLAQLVPFLMAALVWPLFAAVIGATASCGDADGGGSLVFLLSRPVSRNTIWAVKLAVATVSLATVVVVSFVVAELMYLRALGRWYPFPFPADSATEIDNASTRALVLGVVLVCFAATVVVGLFTRESVTAAAAGVTAALTVGATGLLLQSAYSASSRSSDGSEAFMWGFLSTVAVAALAGSFHIFAHGGLLTGGELRRTARVAVLAILVVSVLGAMVSASAATRVDISTASLDETMVVPGARQVVIAAGGNDFAGATYFVAGASDEPRRLTARMASGGVISPDGRWLVYSSRLGPLGVRRADCHLRAVRLDGSDDHLIADQAPCIGPRLFAHDGVRLALQISPSSMLIVDLNGRQEPRVLELGAAAELRSLVRWTDADTELIVVVATSVALIDVASGESEEIYADEAASLIRVRAATDTHMVVYSVIQKRDDSGHRTRSYHQVLLDVRNGETTEFLDACAQHSPLALYAVGSAIIHAGCGDAPREIQGREPPTTGSDWPTPDLWVHDLETGAERLLARLDTEVVGMWPSARTGRILVRGNDRRYFVVEPDGGFRPIDFTVSGGSGPATGWSFEAWIGDGGALLWDRAGRRLDRRHRLAYYDLDTGAGRIIVESECGLC